MPPVQNDDDDDDYDDDNGDNIQAWPTFHSKICSKTQLNAVTGKAPSFNPMMTMMITMTTMSMVRDVFFIWSLSNKDVWDRGLLLNV